MYRIIVASHGPMAQGMKESLEFVMGPAQGVEAVCLDEDGISKFSGRVKEAVEKSGDEETLVLVDFAFGSPFNEFSKEAGSFKKHFEILTGVNLPALVEAVNAQQQGQTLAEAIPAVREASVMQSFTEMLAEQAAGDEDE